LSYGAGTRKLLYNLVLSYRHGYVFVARILMNLNKSFARVVRRRCCQAVKVQHRYKEPFYISTVRPY